MAKKDLFTKNIPLIVIFIFCFCFICTIYSNSINAEFVFDDKISILNNDAIRMDRINAESVLTSMKGNRPIPMLSFAVNYYFGKYSVQGYHVVNILIHIINSILLFFLCRKLMAIARYEVGWELSWLPVLVACTWAVNPVHTQSVTYIVQRMNSMAALFYLVSFIFYLNARTVTSKKQRNTFFFVAIISGILSVLSKEIAVTLPFFILLFEWLFFRDADVGLFKKYVFHLFLGSLFIGIIGYFVIEPVYSNFIAVGYSDYNFNMPQRCLTQFRVVLYYIGLLLFPHPERLNIDYDFPVSLSIVDPVTTLASIFIVLSAFAGAVYLIHSNRTKERLDRRLITFSIFWYFGNLFIESSFIPLDMVFEHRTYLPSALFFLMLFLVLKKVLKKKSIIAFTTIIFMLFCSYWTLERNNVWKTRQSIWLDAVSKSPEKARPYINTGKCFAEKNDYETAYSFFSKALTKKMTGKSLAFIYINLGTHHYRLTQYKTALHYYKKALELQKNHVDAMAGTGAVFVKLKKYEQAKKYLDYALKKVPGNILAHSSLGEMFLGQNMFKNALKHYNFVLKYNTETAISYYNRGAVYLKMGKTDLAIKDLETAASLDNQYALPHIGLGSIYSSMDIYERGILHFKKAIKIDPENIVALKGIARLYYNNKNYANSLKIWRKVLHLNPEDLITMNNIALCYMGDKQFSKAAVMYNQMLQSQPDNHIIYYNLACAYSESGQFKQSVNTLKNAVNKGFSDIDEMKKDPDLSKVMGSGFGKRLLKELN